MQTIERYVATIVDLLNPKPTISAHVITANSGNNSQETATSLLSQLTALYGDSRLISKSLRAFAQKQHQVESLRSTLSRVMNQILSLSRQHANNKNSKASVSKSATLANKRSEFLVPEATRCSLGWSSDGRLRLHHSRSNRGRGRPGWQSPHA